MVQDNKTLYIEKDTNYALQVEYATNINFDEIKRIAKFFVMQLPEAVQNKIYNELDRGVNIIDSEPQLNMYLHSFGNMHQAKMRQAFSNIGTDWFGNKEIEIIDYGCGQALATMLYHDYLQANDISQTVSKITLIEPSEKALCRAGLHAKAFYPNAEIHTINKLLNDVAPTDISHSGKPVLHLFSNILDIEAVDIHHLATIAQAENAEVNTLWVCVSPFFGNHIDNRIPCFLDILNQPKTYTFQRSKGTWLNQWTINCIIAEQKREENLSTEVTDEDEANGIKDEYGVLYSPDGKRLLKGNYDIRSYTIKEGTKVICDSAFDFKFRCSSLQSIVIPDSVTKIGNKAFIGCHSLQNIVIPESVTKIGNKAFISCHSLQNIVIPESVTKIGDEAFKWCKSLQSVVIPESVTKIGKEVFYECSSLQNIVIPESVTEIGEEAFRGCSLQSIVIPESVTEIGKGTFDWCTSLQSIVIPDSVSSIGIKAFTWCASLQSIVIPESVTEIGSCAFLFCSSLQSIVIPESVTKIGDSAFSDCKSLQSIVIPETVTEIGDSAFYNCRSLQSIVIPDSVTKIGDNAFSECKSLQSIVIPESVTKIGNWVFSGCKLLQSIVIPNSVTEIGIRPFSLGIKIISHSNRFIVENDLLIDLEEKRLIQCLQYKEHIVIPESVTSIGGKAFDDCTSLQTIVIPNSATEIGEYWAFWECSSLQSIVISEGTKEHFKRILGHHDLLKEIDYKKIYNSLGMCYEFGIEHERDMKKAEKYYAKAKELEDSKDYNLPF